MELYIPFDTLGKLVDTGDITVENVRALDLKLEIDSVISKKVAQNSSSKSFDSDPEINFT